MKKDVDPVVITEEPVEESYPREYHINTGGGDLYLSINAGKASTVNVNTGQIPPTPPPPKGGS